MSSMSSIWPLPSAMICMHTQGFWTRHASFWSRSSPSGVAKSPTFAVLLSQGRMQHPQKEIFQICKPLLQGTPAEQKAIIEKVFTDDAIFTHPFIVSKGRASVLKTYQMWGLINKRIGFDIERAGKDPLQGSPDREHPPPPPPRPRGKCRSTASKV